MSASMNVMQRKLFFKSLPVIRRLSTTSKLDRGAVLGVYEPKDKDGDIVLNKASNQINEQSSGKLAKVLKIAGKQLKKGGCRVLYDVTPEYTAVAVCCLGKQGVGYNEAEGWDEGAENVRGAVAAGVRSLRDVGEKEVDVDPCGNAEAASEAGHLSLHAYDELKNEDKRQKPVKLSCLGGDSVTLQNLWNRGKTKAKGQNWARDLMEMPSNLLTPTLFAEAVVKRMGNRPNVKVNVRDQSWIENEKMGSFMSVTQGSPQPPVFLHLVYQHPSSTMDTPVALVGKGVTFDTAMDVALGSAAAGVFSTSTHYWSILEQAGSRTGDRVWRMPLMDHYTKQITKCQLADLNNIGGSRSGGACTAAAFLKEFVTCKHWMHLDIAGVMSNKSEVPYLGSGMAGRPTRTIVEFVEAVGKDKQ